MPLISNQEKVVTRGSSWLYSKQSRKWWPAYISPEFQ